MSAAHTEELNCTRHRVWKRKRPRFRIRESGRPRLRILRRSRTRETHRLWWSEPKTQKTWVTEREEKGCGWPLWWYASSLLPPRSPAGASHSIQHEDNNHSLSLCALIHQDGRDRGFGGGTQKGTLPCRWRYLKKFWFSRRCQAAVSEKPRHQRQKNLVQTYQCGRRLHVPAHEHGQDSAEEWSGAATPGSLGHFALCAGVFGSPSPFFAVMQPTLI